VDLPLDDVPHLIYW